MIGFGLILIHKLYGFVVSYEKSIYLGLMMNPTRPYGPCTEDVDSTTSCESCTISMEGSVATCGS